MSAAVRLNDGIEIETETLGTVKCDPGNPDGDWNVLSHAHTDHLPRRVGEQPIVSSSLTADLAGARRDLAIDPTVPERIELVPSGHIDGSRAAIIEDRDRRILYTGDVAVRSRFGLEGFRPPDADVLIVEATYGDPSYTFPAPDVLEQEVAGWVASNRDGPMVCFAYALGKAQRVQRLLERLDVDRVFAAETIVELNGVIEATTGASFPAEPFDDEGDLGPGEALVLPSGRAQSNRVEPLVSHHEAVTAGFSGWAVDSGYRYRREIDRGFPLSDHCDFEELLDLVARVNPERTYLHHGFADELASALTTRGYDTRALKQHQPPLDAF